MKKQKIYNRNYFFHWLYMAWGFVAWQLQKPFSIHSKIFWWLLPHAGFYAYDPKPWWKPMAKK